MSGIPHSEIIKAQLLEYVADASSIMDASLAATKGSGEYRAIYKNSLGTFTSLVKFSKRKLPLLRTAAGIVKRCPLLIATRQVQLAYVELRRLIEVSTSYAYFCEHPVEWRHFQADPASGFARDLERPIAWCAHREFRWYADYIAERYDMDSSGLVAEAIQTHRKFYKELSKFVHAALDQTTATPLSETFDDVDAHALSAFGSVQRDIYRAVLVITAATDRERLGRLTAIERAWYDWVLGSARQKVVRSGSFLAS